MCTLPERAMPQLEIAASTLKLGRGGREGRKSLMRLNNCIIVIQHLKLKFHNCLVISAFMFFDSIMQAAHLVIMKY